MAEVLVLEYKKRSKLEGLNYSTSSSFGSFKALVCSLFKKGNNESDTNHATLVVLDAGKSRKSRLDALSFEDKVLLLRNFFGHMNLIVVESGVLEKSSTIKSLNQAFNKINSLIEHRISRVEVWTGTGDNSVDDVYSAGEELALGISSIISTMSFTLNMSLNKSEKTTHQLKHIKDIIVEEIDFFSLLSDVSTKHLSKLCHLVGHWSFPAHEMSNDDLTYCVYIMLKFALNQVKLDSLHIPTSNELLGFIFIVRDSYKSGNPFHNFRHAVDVLQACFHFSVRLNFLPLFEQFELDPKADERLYISDSKDLDDNVEFVLKPSERKLPLLSPIETLGLLIAALGHDVGHPGVTNAFLIKYQAPTSLLYNERSVLESFHASVFINKVVSIYWPSLLTIFTDQDSQLSVKNLVTSCILATDMAEHFEYLKKLTIFESSETNDENKVKLISSLLIKCADISNVTRPLRVSSQWALVLSREFDELISLEKKLNNESVSKTELRTKYGKVPSSLADILNKNPYLHKGQVFFINTFAENLFNNIVELLPELEYTSDIIKENKQFWLSLT